MQLGDRNSVKSSKSYLNSLFRRLKPYCRIQAVLQCFYKHRYLVYSLILLTVLVSTMCTNLEPSVVFAVFLESVLKVVLEAIISTFFAGSE
jgi:hypothetical protein